MTPARARKARVCACACCTTRASLRTSEGPLFALRSHPGATAVIYGRGDWKRARAHADRVLTARLIRLPAGGRGAAVVLVTLQHDRAGFEVTLRLGAAGVAG